MVASMRPVVVLLTHLVSVHSSRPHNDDASMMHWEMEGDFEEYEDENLMQYTGGASTEYPSLDDQESVREARAMPVRKDPCHDPVACGAGGADEHAFWQRNKLMDDDDSVAEWDEFSMAQRSHTEPEHDELSEEWDEFSMAQRSHTEPEHDEHSLFQDFDENTFFQYGEPEFDTKDDLHLNSNSRLFGGVELLDDSMEECDEFSMAQRSHTEPEHDEHSLFQDFDENTFFQYGEPEFDTSDDLHLNSNSRLFGGVELLDDSMEECDEYAMIQQGESATQHDEQSFFQHDDAETVDDALAEESAVEDYILMQYEGSEYPNLQDQPAVLEARSEALHKGDPNRFFGKAEL